MLFDFLLLLIFLFLLYTVAQSLFSLAPFVPTKKTDYQRIAKLANLKNGDEFIDLGCGFGGLLKYLSQQHQGITGIELNFFIFFPAFLQSLLKKRKYNIIWGNALKKNLKKYNVIYIFAASPEHLKPALIEKLENELAPYSRVITYCFPIKNWEAKEISKPQNSDLSIYLYEL